MDQQSLEDLLALIELRNITAAARHRNISQPAYSRRLKAIEDRNNIELVDRSGRPAVPTQALHAMQEEIEMALTSIKRLNTRLLRKEDIDPEITIAAIHTLAAGPLPEALSRVNDKLAHIRIRTRVKSGNQDICFQQLMTEEASIMLTYETAEQRLQAPANLVKKTFISTDRLIPVCTPSLAEELMHIPPGQAFIPLIAYPSNIFLGQVIRNNILAHSPHIFSKKLIAGMTSVCLAAAKTGIGIAWLPASVVKNELRKKELVIIEDLGFLGVDLEISMLQLRTKKMQKNRELWTTLAEAMSEVVNTPMSESAMGQDR